MRTSFLPIKLSPEKIAYLNVGCGNHFSTDWNNLDLVSRAGVESFDIRRPLPYPDRSFDAVYCSHVLEHLPVKEGKDFLREQFRILKPAGICRIAVPDLERVCRLYLQHLEEAERVPSRKNLLAYDWCVLQLLDQLVRSKPGGRMTEALASGDYDPDFVRALFGDEFASYARPPAKADRTPAPAPKPMLSLARKTFRRIKPAKPVDPRQSGESHHWLYDRLSLKLALTELGFVGFGVKTYLQSDIPHWSKYNLDLSSDGKGARKPDSIFVEARKPPGRQVA